MSSRLPKSALSLKQGTVTSPLSRELRECQALIHTCWPNAGWWIRQTLRTSSRFLVRQEVLQLYRDMFRTIRKVEDESTRIALRDWARSDFKKNMHHTDETTIKTMLFYGKKSLKDLQNSLALSSS